MGCRCCCPSCIKSVMGLTQLLLFDLRWVWMPYVSRSPPAVKICSKCMFGIVPCPNLQDESSTLQEYLADPDPSLTPTAASTGRMRKNLLHVQLVQVAGARRCNSVLYARTETKQTRVGAHNLVTNSERASTKEEAILRAKEIIWLQRRATPRSVVRNQLHPS